MNTKRSEWEGIPCILPDWIYTADISLFEARQAVKRQNANYFAEVFGVGASESEGEEILKMIRAARETVKSAEAVQQELVIEAQARGVPIKEIGDALGVKSAAVSMSTSRKKLTSERQLEISRESQAWATLTDLWRREIDTDEPGESFFMYGTNYLLGAEVRLRKSINMHIEGRDMVAVAKKMNSAFEFLDIATESLTDPQIPHVITKYAPKIIFNGNETPGVTPGTAAAYIQHGIFEVILARITLADALKGPLLSSGDIMLANIYISRALVSLSRPEAMFVSDKIIDFLRREHPHLVPSERFSDEQLSDEYLTGLYRRTLDLDDNDENNLDADLYRHVKVREDSRRLD